MAGRPTWRPASCPASRQRACHHYQRSEAVTVKIVPNDKGNPPGKLADAELHFISGPLEGLKLIGFAVWERKTGNGRNVTFPARAYSGQRRATQLRAAPSDWRYDSAEPRSAI